MNVLDIQNLSLKIGNKEILKDISFSIPKGCIYGLVGHNGAGKTSILRILLGFTPKYDGKLLLFENSDLQNQRAKIGAVMDSLEPDPNATALEYLFKVGQMNGVTDKTFAKELLKKVGLADCTRKKIKTFSLGMKRRLMIACALIGEPQLLILDEPFNGIDPRGMAELRLIMQMLVTEGMTILVTSHIIPELIKLANQFGVMHDGRFIDSLSSKDLLCANYAKTVIKVYNPLPFIEQMSKKHPQICCLSDSLGEVSIFSDIEYDEIKDVCESFDIKATDFSKSFMTGEDILLWKMEGYIN